MFKNFDWFGAVAFAVPALVAIFALDQGYGWWAYPALVSLGVLTAEVFGDKNE